MMADPTQQSVTRTSSASSDSGPKERALAIGNEPTGLSVLHAALAFSQCLQFEFAKVNALLFEFHKKFDTPLGELLTTPNEKKFLEYCKENDLSLQQLNFRELLQQISGGGAASLSLAASQMPGFVAIIWSRICKDFLEFIASHKEIAPQISEEDETDPLIDWLEQAFSRVNTSIADWQKQFSVEVVASLDASEGMECESSSNTSPVSSSKPEEKLAGPAQVLAAIDEMLSSDVIKNARRLSLVSLLLAELSDVRKPQLSSRSNSSSSTVSSSSLSDSSGKEEDEEELQSFISSSGSSSRRSSSSSTVSSSSLSDNGTPPKGASTFVNALVEELTPDNLIFLSEILQNECQNREFLGYFREVWEENRKVEETNKSSEYLKRAGKAVAVKWNSSPEKNYQQWMSVLKQPALAAIPLTSTLKTPLQEKSPPTPKQRYEAIGMVKLRDEIRRVEGFSNVYSQLNQIKQSILALSNQHNISILEKNICALDNQTGGHFQALLSNILNRADRLVKTPGELAKLLDVLPASLHGKFVWATRHSVNYSQDDQDFDFFVKMISKLPAKQRVAFLMEHQDLVTTLERVNKVCSGEGLLKGGVKFEQFSLKESKFLLKTAFNMKANWRDYRNLSGPSFGERLVNFFCVSSCLFFKAEKKGVDHSDNILRPQPPNLIQP